MKRKKEPDHGPHNDLKEGCQSVSGMGLGRRSAAKAGGAPDRLLRHLALIAQVLKEPVSSPNLY